MRQHRSRNGIDGGRIWYRRRPRPRRRERLLREEFAVLGHDTHERVEAVFTLLLAHVDGELHVGQQVLWRRRVHEHGHAVAAAESAEARHAEPRRAVVPGLLIQVQWTEHQKRSTGNALQPVGPQALLVQVDAALPVVARPLGVDQRTIRRIAVLGQQGVDGLLRRGDVHAGLRTRGPDFWCDRGLLHVRRCQRLEQRRRRQLHLVAALQAVREAASRCRIELSGRDPVGEGHHLGPVAQARQRCDDVEGLRVPDGHVALLQQATNEAGQQLQLRDIHVSLLGRSLAGTRVAGRPWETRMGRLGISVRLRRTPKGACGRRRQPCQKITRLRHPTLEGRARTGRALTCVRAWHRANRSVDGRTPAGRPRWSPRTWLWLRTPLPEPSTRQSCSTSGPRAPADAPR